MSVILVLLRALHFERMKKSFQLPLKIFLLVFLPSERMKTGASLLIPHLPQGTWGDWGTRWCDRRRRIFLLNFCFVSRIQQQQNHSRNLFASTHVVAQLWWTRESKLSPQLSQENWDEGKFSSIGAELCHCIIVHQVNNLTIGSSWSHREGDPSFLEGRWSSWLLVAPTPTPTCQIPQHRYKCRYKYRHKYKYTYVYL